MNAEHKLSALWGNPLDTARKKVMLLEEASATILRMIDWSSCPTVEQDPARVGGAWVFTGSRVPVAALFENLEDEASVHDFVEWFPGVTL